MQKSERANVKIKPRSQRLQARRRKLRAEELLRQYR